MSDCEVKYLISASADSAIVVEVREKRMFREHKYFLSFQIFSGELYYVATNPTSSRLALEINSRSITCNDSRLSPGKQRRLASHAKNFVSASGAPAVRFSSHSMTAKQFRGFLMSGLLDLGGTTRSISINVTFVPSGLDRLEIEGDSTIRFSDFGSKPPSSLFGTVGFIDPALTQFHLFAVRTAVEPWNI